VTAQRIVIVGGGHNALVAAAYLARAGREVTVLERLDHVGGAAVSERAFAGVDASLSRYSYLVSLLPQSVVDDLGLSIRLARRRYASYTPVPGERTGLLIDRADARATDASLRAIAGRGDARRWQRLGERLERLAAAVFPTMTEPLPLRAELAAAVDDEELWTGLVERPIAELIEGAFRSDLVRGVVATDALIGTFAALDDPALPQNRCFLYHVIGGGTGEWNVPVGGMGAVTSELERAARRSGATIMTGADVTAVDPDGEVTYRHGDAEHRLGADRILAGVAPAVLERLVTGSATTEPEGAQVKVNLLLRRLPRLREPGVDPRAAFSGTLHVNEGYVQLGRAHAAAAAGDLPEPLPLEVYCHSLTDPSILAPRLREAGAQTLTAFGLHTPHRLALQHGPERLRRELGRAVVASLESVLDEPLADVLLTDEHGLPCIETKTTADLERDLGMAGGDIFHGGLDWPFLEAPAESASERWGVASGWDRVLLCGSGSRRGGGVSGLGGRSAAMAVLEGA
jgi:phytoene dehydrogenase-like protein